MKTKRKKSVGNTSAAQAPIVIKQGGSGIVGPLILLGGAFAGYFFVVKPYLAERATDKAEGDTSPEANVANQFVSVFGGRGDKNWHVADKDYNTAALSLTDANKEKVYKIYKNLTDRNLSVDIANHISPDVKVKADKIQAINSKSGGLFRITPEGNIKFEIIKGDKIRFAAGQTKPVDFYNAPNGIILNEMNSPELNKKLAKDPKTAGLTVKITVKPSARLFTVIQTKIIPYENVKLVTDSWKSFSLPFVKVSKTFAAVQVFLGKNKAGKAITGWVDARELMTWKIKAIKGLGSHAQNLL